MSIVKVNATPKKMLFVFNLTNPTGTEVAAVTYAMPEPAAAPGEEPVFNRYYADRPFVPVLFDTKTNAVLQTAAIVNP